jgi:hypothetical protein
VSTAEVRVAGSQREWALVSFRFPVARVLVTEPRQRGRGSPSEVLLVGADPRRRQSGPVREPPSSAVGDRDARVRSPLYQADEDPE